MEPQNNFIPSETHQLNQQAKYNSQNKPSSNSNQFQSMISHQSKINRLGGILVKQRMNMMEVITGCEMESIFDIFEKHPSEEKIRGKRLWRAIEESTCLQRNCVAQNCRSFKLKILNVQGGPIENEPICLTMERPCSCSCFCMNRPFITMNYVENGNNVYLGKISDPYNLAKTLFMVRDKHDNPIYKIETCCVQCGVVCRGCVCAPCQKVTFQVTDLKSGRLVFPISKTNNSCLKELVLDSDNFSIDFTPETSWEDKSLLLGAILFIDYMMFEEKGGM